MKLIKDGATFFYTHIVSLQLAIVASNRCQPGSE